MAWNLRDLIRASGKLGVDGQTFYHDVAHGSMSKVNAALADYKITGWSWEVSTEPALPGDFTYNDGHVFALSSTILGGTRNHLIREASQRNGSGKVALSWSTVDGYEPVVTYNNVTNAAAGPVEVTIAVTAPFNFTGFGITKGADWRDYPGQQRHVDDGALVVRLVAGVTSTPGGTEDVNFTLTYVPDAGPFNATLSKQWTYRINKRSLTVNDFDWEWHTNNTQSARVSQSNIYDFSSEPYYTATFYLYYKQKGSSTWTLQGSYTWQDDQRSEI